MRRADIRRTVLTPAQSKLLDILCSTSQDYWWPTHTLAYKFYGYGDYYSKRALHSCISRLNARLPDKLIISKPHEYGYYRLADWMY